MLKIDPWNIIWTVVNLLFLYWIFKKFLFDRVMGVINQRDEMIQKQFSEAKKSQDDAESLNSPSPPPKTGGLSAVPPAITLTSPT